MGNIRNQLELEKELFDLVTGQFPASRHYVRGLERFEALSQDFENLISVNQQITASIAAAKHHFEKELLRTQASVSKDIEILEDEENPKLAEGIKALEKLEALLKGRHFVDALIFCTHYLPPYQQKVEPLIRFLEDEDKLYDAKSHLSNLEEALKHMAIPKDPEMIVQDYESFRDKDKKRFSFTLKQGGITLVSCLASAEADCEKVIARLQAIAAPKVDEWGVKSLNIEAKPEWADTLENLKNSISEAGITSTAAKLQILLEKSKGAERG